VFGEACRIDVKRRTASQNTIYMPIIALSDQSEVVLELGDDEGDSNFLLLFLGGRDRRG